MPAFAVQALRSALQAEHDKGLRRAFGRGPSDVLDANDLDRRKRHAQLHAGRTASPGHEQA
jgi:hypothetical protein